MSMNLGRIPMSQINIVLTGTLAGGIALMAALSLWTLAVMLALVLVLSLFGIRAARRAGASRVCRVNALEYRDEHDWMIARDGLAAVGAVALVLSVVGFTVMAALSPGLSGWRWLVFGQVIVLLGLWGVANHLAARRYPPDVPGREVAEPSGDAQQT